MILAEFLEEFGSQTPNRAEDLGSASPREIQAYELSAYESGYKAGWEDAAKANDADADSVSADFNQNLKDLSFTYHEAYSHILKSLEPLFDQISKTIMPVFLHETLGVQIAEVLMRQARNITPMSAEILVPQAQLSTVEPLVAHDYGFPVTVAADEALKDGEADIRLGAVEEHVNLSEIVEGMRAAIIGFTRENRRAAANG